MDLLKANRSYECMCGKNIAFEFAASYILEHLRSNSGKSTVEGLGVAVVSDRQVSGYYYNKFENQFIDRGIRPVLVSVECSDSTKNLGAVEKITEALNDFDFKSSDWVIALGGGGVLDAAAFAVAIYDGSVGFMAVPTTLNAMCEGVVSPKAYLNFKSHKNQLSVPFKPDIVMIDPTFFKTVSSKIKNNGFAAIIRYAILQDTSLLKDMADPEDLRVYLDAVYDARSSVEYRNPILLTVGDEIASAIESYFRFMSYSEGEALALSLLATVDDKRRSILKNIYEGVGLPTKLEGVSGQMIKSSLKKQLARKGGDEITFVDFDIADGGNWVIRKEPFDTALEVLGSRVERII